MVGMSLLTKSQIVTTENIDREIAEKHPRRFGFDRAEFHLGR